jgi:hypothetical protein
MSQDPNDLLKTVADHFRDIKFGTGVVGRTSYAAYSIIPIWLVVLARLSDNGFLNACLLGAGILATGFIVWWIRSTQKFVEKNPNTALLDGAQLLEYHRQQHEFQAKGLPTPSGAQVLLQPDPKLPATPIPDPGPEDRQQ